MVGSRRLGMAKGKVGIVGLGVATYFGVHAGSLNDASKQDGHCDGQNRCDTYGGQKRDDAKSAAEISTISPTTAKYYFRKIAEISESPPALNAFSSRARPPPFYYG